MVQESSHKIRGNLAVQPEPWAKDPRITTERTIAPGVDGAYSLQPTAYSTLELVY